MIIAIVDTSVLCELLQVPGKFDPATHQELVAEFQERLNAGHQFLVPLTAIIEAGNHIAHGGDGGGRRAAATRFVTWVRDAIDGRVPFTATPAPAIEEVGAWLGRFVDDAMRQLSLGDRSIIAAWEQQREIHPYGRIYVWSLDDDLIGYDTDPDS